MVASLHPHWHSTDTEEVSVPVHASKTHTEPVRRYAVRHPAAIVGVMLVLGLGMVFVRGVQELRGQAGGSPVIIRITPAGLEPQDVSLSPGQTITWRNEQDAPHILTSDALPVEGGILSTPHILPGTDFSARIAPDAEPGNFTYVSLTAENITGTVTIAAPAPTPLPSSIAAPVSAGPSRPIAAPVSAGPSRPIAPLASIPRNPYALEGTPIPPSPALSPQIPPLPPSSRGTPLPPLAASVRPFTQPQTGPRGMGAALIISMILVVGLCVRLTRKGHS
ncbi:hypothetical protein HYZ98_00605 [Candidatus Peregrinibacteria bacterium]|nr:hypothetical protein [Candidatus Peregrinibacteria bacterium]